MTTEYHDEVEDDNNSFWNKETAPVYVSGVSMFRRWLFPGLTATAILLLIIVLGATGGSRSSWLWSLDQKVSNLTGSLSATQQLAEGAARDVHRLKFSVESNKDELSSVADALKQLSVLDSLSRTVASLKCTIERTINNGSLSAGCCPLDWEALSSSCYLFSRTSLSWPEARDWCSAHGAHLAMLTTDEEWDFVILHTSGTYYWLGLTDQRTGEWEWVNQTPYVMNRRRWKPGQPDSWTGHGVGPGDEDCAHLLFDGRLNDLHCATKLRFVCQQHGQRG
ncbi:asialoglycoprotein receptor 1 [Pseudoliparis swirei]|uniref:asialoglycoprotein receptor 1 n=1 Tax=Pseudoliparis swirei TaxID=2059687 RepID=UPI0024BE8108|nr:asialoglycoprotein receptor 1 [Pseudoliparis swirei]